LEEGKEGLRKKNSGKSSPFERLRVFWGLRKNIKRKRLRKRIY
jgi:hypothetical protein